MFFHSHPYRLALLYSLLLALLLALLAILLTTNTAAAQEPVLPAHADPHFTASYWDNINLAGSPVLERSEANLEHNWDTASPDFRLPSDYFSARWLRYIDLAAGIYRFTATSDDGIRVYLDDQILIDHWTVHAEETYYADVQMAAGHHLLRVEYFEHEGVAVVKVRWQPVMEVTSGEWRGEYYNNASLSGGPTRVRYDADLTFDWGKNSPANDIDRDHFSVRWTRTLYFKGGRYRFTTETDDGVRLYIDGELVIDEWQRMARTEFSKSRNLDRGNHTIRMEYFEATGYAFAELSWDRLDEEEEEGVAPVGNIITCVPPQPNNCAWIKVYRLDPNGAWIDISRAGFTSLAANGYLKIDGLFVDINTFGNAGHPYRVEQWLDDQLIYSTGNVQNGEPTFRVRPFVDNYTSWQCSP